MEDCSQTIDSCRNKQTALHLKTAAIVTILLASTLGVLLPIIGKRLKTLRTDGNVFFVTKAFAAGVILATGFVHMLPDAQEALTSPCLPEHPWAKFPWQGFIAMMAALATLVVDFLATVYYENKHSASPHAHAHGNHFKELDSAPMGIRDGLVAPAAAGEAEKRDGESKQDTYNSESAHGGGGGMHIVGMRAHAASHPHEHADGQQLVVPVEQDPDSKQAAAEVSLRHVVISQVLELGIVAHSVIIGLTLGVSESPCTIRPLMAALVFHQFFEGFALGGCISQAGFKLSQAAIMAFFFAVTTPFGICLGIGIASSYNDNSPNALIVEGVLDAISAGILIYTSLVDLIAADFLSKRLRCDRPLQLFSYIALFSGAGAMSGIAIWA